MFTHKMAYATRAVLDIGLHWGERPVLLRDIAQRQAIPLPYLERLASRLRAAGVLRSTRGPHGGYQLARDPRRITLLDIVEALDGPQTLRDIVPRRDQSVTAALWRDVGARVRTHLQSVTVADLRERHRARLAHAGDYAI